MLSAPRRMAQLSASEPQEVKYSSSLRQPRADATCFRAFPSASLAARPA